MKVTAVARLISSHRPCLALLRRTFLALAGQLVAAHGRLVEFHALVAITPGDFLAPHEDPCPDALRAGVAAPHAASEHGDEEQAEGTDDQQAGKEDEVLRPEGRAEDVELALGQVPEHRLAAVPLQPQGAEEQQEQQRTAKPAEVAETPRETFGVNGRSDRRQRFRRRGEALRCVDLDDLRGDSFAHYRGPSGRRGAATVRIVLHSKQIQVRWKKPYQMPKNAPCRGATGLARCAMGRLIGPLAATGRRPAGAGGWLI